jgi:hypothetical protein
VRVTGKNELEGDKMEIKTMKILKKAVFAFLVLLYWQDWP